MSTPFTQYVLPDGRKRDETIERPPEIEATAQKFIEAGGRYECEVLTTGVVSLTAVMNDDDGEPDDVEIVLCRDGPDIPLKVDELVKLSAAHILVVWNMQTETPLIPAHVETCQKYRDRNGWWVCDRCGSHWNEAIGAFVSWLPLSCVERPYQQLQTPEKK